jgi:hypothetical protein
MSEPQLQSYTIKATIPTGSYANIQPEITVTAESMEAAKATVMPHIQTMYREYSDIALRPNKVQGVIELLKSFNEGVELEFDREAHTYMYNGQRLESASGFTARHTKKFDTQGVSKQCEGKWGIPQVDILGLWKSNGDAAAGFGTAIHAVLEHYFKMKSIGQTIMENSKKEVNAALPNHPFLQKLIQELEVLMPEEGENLQEILISNVEKGFCGLVDNLLILDAENKVCRIRDYKIAYDVEKKGDKLLTPFDVLPPTKLSKYQVQLSFYANLLQFSGWTVEGLDIFAYDGEWKKYPLEVLQVIN